MKIFVAIYILMFGIKSFAADSLDSLFAAKDPRDNPKVASVKIETAACEGYCPVFSLYISSDGNVEYVGYENTKFKEVRVGKINKFEVENLFEFIREVNLFKYKDKYNSDITDQSARTTTIVMHNGKVKVIYNYANIAPSSVWAVEELVILYESKVVWEKNK